MFLQFIRPEKLDRLDELTSGCTTLTPESLGDLSNLGPPIRRSCADAAANRPLMELSREFERLFQYILCRISGTGHLEARNGRYAEPNKHFLSDDKPYSRNSSTNDDEGSGAWGSIALVLPVLLSFIASHSFENLYVLIVIITRTPPGPEKFQSESSEE